MPGGWRRVCFTLNNYTAADEERIRLLADCSGATCVLYGREVGELGETPHLQGYIEWKYQRTLLQWKGALGDRAHIESAAGTRWDSWCYCTKEDESPFYRPCDFGFWSERTTQKAASGYAEPMRKINEGKFSGFFLVSVLFSAASRARPC